MLLSLLKPKDKSKPLLIQFSGAYGVTSSVITVSRGQSANVEVSENVHVLRFIFNGVHKCLPRPCSQKCYPKSNIILFLGT